VDAPHRNMSLASVQGLESSSAPCLLHTTATSVANDQFLDTLPCWPSVRQHLWFVPAEPIALFKLQFGYITASHVIGVAYMVPGW